MLKIRTEQLDALEADLLRRFEERAIEHLRMHFHDLTQLFSDEQLRQRIRECTVRSKRYGLSSEQEIMCFADTTFLLGNDFDLDPAISWARDLLDDNELDSSDKAETLLEWAVEEWEGENDDGREVEDEKDA
jgi:hypothetical protein